MSMKFEKYDRSRTEIGLVDSVVIRVSTGGTKSLVEPNGTRQDFQLSGDAPSGLTSGILYLIEL